MKYTQEQMEQLLKDPECILCQLNMPRSHKEIIEWMKDNKRLIEFINK